MVIVLQERCFLSTCSDLADDTKTKSEVGCRSAFGSSPARQTVGKSAWRCADT